MRNTPNGGETTGGRLRYLALTLLCACGGTPELKDENPQTEIVQTETREAISSNFMKAMEINWKNEEVKIKNIIEKYESTDFGSIGEEEREEAWKDFIKAKEIFEKYVRGHDWLKDAALSSMTNDPKRLAEAKRTFRDFEQSKIVPIIDALGELSRKINSKGSLPPEPLPVEEI